jgi:hypothetical protein
MFFRIMNYETYNFGMIKMEIIIFYMRKIFDKLKVIYKNALN